MNQPSDAQKTVRLIHRFGFTVCSPATLNSKSNDCLGILREVDERLETHRILNRDFAEHLTVERHTSLDEAGNELAVAQTFSTGCRIDAGNPKVTEVTLLQLAMSSRQTLGAVDRLGSGAEKFGTSTAETLGEFQTVATTLT